MSLYNGYVVSLTSLPARLGPYLLIHRIGEGGLADVYLALHGGESFAIKCLKPERATSDRYVADFVREIKIASSLEHPNILSTIDHGKTDGVYFSVMKLVVGTTLSQIVLDWNGEGKQIPLPFALYILRECLNALRYLHRKTVFENSQSVVFHGDLSPDNILITQDGRTLLMDFGSAGQVTATDPRDHHLGKMYYLPADVMEKKSVTTQTDLYSLGVIAFYLLYGVHPFEGKNKFELYKAIRKGELPRLDSSQIVRSKLDEVALRIFFNKALNKNPDLRFHTVDEFEQAFSALRFTASFPKTFSEVHEHFNEAAAKRLQSVESDWSARISNHRMSEQKNSIPKTSGPVESLLAKIDQRKHPRVSVEGQKLNAEVTVTQKKFKANFAIHEISQGGMLAKCEGIKPSTGEKYPIVVHLDDGGAPIRAVGRIVYTVSKTSKLFAGFQFIELPPLAEKRLGDYVLSKMTSAEKPLAAQAEDPAEPHIDIFFSSVDEFRSEFEKNIQHGGMFVRSTRPMGDNETVVLRIQLPQGLRRVLLRGKVVYCKPLEAVSRSDEKHGVGIQLIESQPKLRELFADIVS